jgi:hypothetical protein
MPERRVFKSHPDFTRLNDLADKIARANNPHLFYDLKDFGKLPEPERNVIITELEEAMERELEGGVFRDYIDEKGVADPLDVRFEEPGKTRDGSAE